MLGTLTWEDLATIGYEAGRYLGRIHQIPLDVFGEFWPDASHVPGPHQHAADQSIRHEKAYLLSQVAPWLEACAGQALLPAETIEALGQLFARTELLDRGQACLIHGAYDAHSVIVERGTTGYHVTGILDLEHAIGGSPELDMSYFLGYRFEKETTFQGERVRKEFLDGYAESGEIRADFWDRLRIYQLFTCLRCISARPQADPKTEAMPWHCTDSPEREMCQRWIHRNLEQLEHSI
jgi:aminoglycoside phosphotransferase (APT) family kinase protein